MHGIIKMKIEYSIISIYLPCINSLNSSNLSYFKNNKNDYIITQTNCRYVVYNDQHIFFHNQLCIPKNTYSCYMNKSDQNNNNNNSNNIYNEHHYHHHIITIITYLALLIPVLLFFTENFLLIMSNKVIEVFMNQVT
jgi:hypothetical protein